MRTFVQEPKATQQTKSESGTNPCRTFLEENHDISANSRLQRTSGKQTVQRLLKTHPNSLEDSQHTTNATPYSGLDFSQIPVHSRTPYGVPFNANARAHYKLHRHAAGTGPATAPEIVHEVLRGPGQPIPANLQHDMEAMLGHDFADVSVHTDERAGASAKAVSAYAYTVGRHIVFAPGRFDTRSAQGRQLLAHELTHAAGHPKGMPTPSGDLRISTPAEAAERHAITVSEGSIFPAVAPATQPGLFRQPAGLVALTGVTVNHDRVTVPPSGRLSFSATITPANASGVTLSVVGDNATISARTLVNNTTGAITVAAGQTGGSAHIEANQNATGPGGSTLVSTSPATAPFNFTAIPSGITSTTASLSGTAGFYGGEFTHTFTSPAGGQTALELSHVNERFAAASGTTLRITGTLGTLTITINNPGSAAAGWDLDSSGTMTGADHVTWSNTLDARPFVANASHPSPSPGLPQALTATQNFRNLTFPRRRYGAAAVASTTHRRAIEDRNNRLKAVTSANASGINQEIVEDYAGPTVFRRCQATPTSIRVSSPTPPGGTPPAMDASTITVDAEGQSATPTFSIRSPDLGCTITPGGILTPGTTDGTVTVRAGDTANFDETTVILKPRPATFIRVTSASSPAQIILDNNLAQRGIDVASLRRLNPEIQSNSTIAVNTVIWLRAREVAALPTATAIGFEAIAERYFGSRHRWPTVWSFNPAIRDPASIQPTTRIHLQSASDRTRFGEVPLL